MTEFDFDELDKAVNDLMSGVDTSKRNTSIDDPADTVIALDTSAASVSTTPAATTQIATPEPAVAVTSQSQAAPLPSSSPLTTKRRGQFMDVMHPSSDMKSSVKPVSRQAQAIQPTGDVASQLVVAAPLDEATPPVLPDGEQATDDMTASLATETIATETPHDSVTSSDSPWPDPIDMAEQQTDEPVSGTTPAVAENAREASVEAVETEAVVEPVAPLTSPFLPDAKVEKRPLGEPISTAIMTDEASPTNAQTPTPTEESVPTDGALSTLPDELQNDVVALESMTTTPPEASAPVEPTTTTESIPTGQGATTVSTGGSIIRQYTEQPSSGDQTNGAIYDTKDYHQPVEASQPVKKSSPLTFIVWTIVLLIIGAIAGAAFFYFTR